MGLLSTLAKIGGIAAAPFTGGASLALSALGDIGNVASSASKGRAEGRADEAAYLLDRDRLALQRASQGRDDAFRGADLDLARRAQGSQLDDANLTRAVRLGLLGSNPTVTAPAHIASRMATFSDVGPQGVQGRDEIIAALRPRVIDSLAKGQSYQPLTLEDLPQLSTPSQPGKMDSLLNILGTVGAGAGLIGSHLKPKSTPGATPEQLGLTRRTLPVRIN